MQAPVQITFRGIPSSDAIEARVQEEAEKLGKFHNNITSCRVVIESPHHSQTKGNLYHTAIYLSVPGGAIEVTKDNRKDHSHENAYISVRDSFREAARQLDDRLDKRRHQVRTHIS